MNRLKRILILVLCITTIFSMTPLMGGNTSSAATAQKVKVEIVDTNEEIVFGYYVKYKINGIEFCTTTAGQRINQIAWEHMNDDQKKKTIKTFATRFSDMKKQFGSEYAVGMNNWYNDITGWTELSDKWKEKIIKANLSSYYDIFEEDSTYYNENIKPACHENIEDFDVIKTMYGELSYDYSAACTAYEAMCNAEVLKYRVSVMSLSGDLISLITDKCLVPNITPDGSGLLSTEIATNCFDYVANITGIVDGLQDYVVGKRIRSSDAAAVIDDCNELISHHKSFIDSCLHRAEALKNDIDTRYNTLKEQEEGEYATANTSEADLLMAADVDFDTLEADVDIESRIDELTQRISQIEAQQPSNTLSEDWDTWKASYDEAVRQKESYISTTLSSVTSSAKNWRDSYIGNVTSGFSSESQVGTLFATAPMAPLLYDTMAGNLIKPLTGNICATNAEFNQGVITAQKYIEDFYAYIEAAKAYAQSARSLAKAARIDFSAIYSKAIALKNANVDISEIETYMDQTEHVLSELTGKGSNESELGQAYMAEGAFVTFENNLAEYEENLANNQTIRTECMDYVQDQVDEYKQAVADYEQAVADIDTAYDQTETFTAGLPAYIKNQSVTGHLDLDSSSELSSISTQSQIDTYAEQLDGYVDSYQQKESAMYDAERIAQFKSIKVKNMQNRFSTFDDYGINDSTLKSWEEVKDTDVHELSNDSSGDISALKMLWRDFNGRGYGHSQMIEYFADLSDNADKYKTSVKQADVDEFEIIKRQVSSYNMGAYSYTYNIEHPRLLNSTRLLMSSGSLGEIDPRASLVMPLVNEISNARASLSNNIRNVSVSLSNPSAGAKIDSENNAFLGNYAISHTDGFVIDNVRAFDEDFNVIHDRLEAGQPVKFRIYYHIDDDNYCIDPGCIYMINDEIVPNGSDSYGKYIVINDSVTAEETGSGIEITKQPVSVTYDHGDTVTFTCEATGDNLNYQWKKITYPYKDKTIAFTEDISGATDPFLVMEDVGQIEDGTDVYCEIYNDYESVDSEKASLNCSVGIVSQPDSEFYFDIGKDIRLTINTKGENARFQWYRIMNGEEDYEELTEETTNEIYIPSAGEEYNNCTYYCMVSFGDVEILSNFIYLQMSTGGITLKNPLPEEISACPYHEVIVDAETAEEGEYSYSWHLCSLDGETENLVINIGDSAVLRYTPDAFDHGRYIYCNISDGSGNEMKIPYIRLNIRHDDEVTTVEKATPSKDGSITSICSKCGVEVSRLDIHRPDQISLSSTSYTYDGTMKKPKVTIRDIEGNELIEGKDFTITYSSNVSAGTGKVSISYIGNYSGTASKTFTIKPKTVSSKLVKLSSSKLTYTGKAIKPAVTVSGLKSGIDYAVSYANNKNPGKATVKITGKGNYTFGKTITLNFTIQPKKAAISKLTSGMKKLTVKMTTKPAVKGAYKYQIGYKLKGTNKWKYTTTTTQSKIIKSLKKGKKYYIKVRSYKNGQYSGWSATKLSGKIK